jgi:hypothetical protein
MPAALRTRLPPSTILAGGWCGRADEPIRPLFFGDRSVEGKSRAAFYSLKRFRNGLPATEAPRLRSTRVKPREDGAPPRRRRPSTEARAAGAASRRSVDARNPAAIRRVRRRASAQERLKTRGARPFGVRFPEARLLCATKGAGDSRRRSAAPDAPFESAVGRNGRRGRTARRGARRRCGQGGAGRRPNRGRRRG